jgi:uncharacterized protein (TIGR03083 family)
MTDTAHLTISEILDALAETLKSLEDVLATLEPDEWHRATGCPGWDVKDVVSHIIGLEDQLAGLPDPEHELPESFDRPLGADSRRIEIQVDARRQLPTEEILRQFRASTSRGLARRRASERPASEMTDGPFGWRMPYWQLLSIRTFDCFAHEQDVRRAIDRPGNLDGKAASLVGDLVAGVLPGLLAQRVAELDGRLLVIDVPAEGASTGRRIAIGSAGPSDTVTTLTVSLGDLIAFACGRSDADAQRVVVTGDEELAAHVLGAIGFTP